MKYRRAMGRLVAGVFAAGVAFAGAGRASAEEALP
jgi:hypothetical protein